MRAIAWRQSRSAVVSANQPTASLIYETGTPHKLVTNADLAGSFTAYAPEVYGNFPQGGLTWNSGISIQNVGSGSANVTVTFYDQSGSQVGNLASNSALCSNCMWVVSYSSNMPNNFSGSALIQSTQPIAAVVNTSNNGSGDTKASYTASNR